MLLLVFFSCKEEGGKEKYNPEKAGAEIINSVEISGWPAGTTAGNSDVTFDASRLFVRQNNILYIFEKSNDDIRRMNHFGLPSPVFSSYNKPSGMALFGNVLIIPSFNHNALVYDIVITLGGNFCKQVSLNDIRISIPEDSLVTSLNIGKNHDDNTLWIWVTYSKAEIKYDKYFIYEFNFINISEIIFNKLSEKSLAKPQYLYCAAINGTELWYYSYDQDNSDNNIPDIPNIYLCDLNDISNVLKTVKLNYLGIQDKAGGFAYDGIYLWVTIGDKLLQLKPL